jgi:hypothetical protein
MNRDRFLASTSRSASVKIRSWKSCTFFMMSGTARRTLNEASMTESGLNPEMFDRYPLERGIGDDQAVRADQSKQAAMKLISAALVVTVQKHDFRPDFVLLPSFKVFSARETDEMFLESAPWFGANALLFGTDRDPTGFPHAFEKWPQAAIRSRDACRHSKRPSPADGEKAPARRSRRGPRRDAGPFCKGRKKRGESRNGWPFRLRFPVGSSRPP